MIPRSPQRSLTVRKREGGRQGGGRAEETAHVFKALLSLESKERELGSSEGK